MTLPSEIREVLEVAEGDIVEFEVLRVVRRPTSPPSSSRTSSESVSL